MRPQDVFKAKPPPQLLIFALKHSLNALRRLRRSGVSLNPATFLLAIQDGLPPGFLSLDPLRSTLVRLMERLGRADRFDDLLSPLLIPAVHLDSGRRVIFGGADRRHIPVSLAVAASCAIPGLIEPVNIEGQDYVDGAIGDTGHLDLAIASGARSIVLINPVVAIDNDGQEVCFPDLDGKCSRLRQKGLSYIVEQARRVSRSAKLRSEMQCLPAEHPDCRVFVIQPDPREGTDFLRSPLSDQQKLHHLDFGYRIARRFLVAHRDELLGHLAPHVPPPGLTNVDVVAGFELIDDELGFGMIANAR